MDPQKTSVPNPVPTNTETPSFSVPDMDIPPSPVAPQSQAGITSPSPIPAVPPPPPPLSGSSSTNPSIVVTSGNGSSAKKAIFAVLGIIVLLLVAFAIVKLVLPRVGGKSSTTITWQGLWETPETVQPLIDEYEQSNPNVVIKYTQESKEQYRERLANGLAQGNGPDIMTIHNSWVPMFKNYLSVMPSTVMTTAEYSQTFYPIMTSDMTLGSGLVGIPTGYDGLGLYINDEIFNTYGKTPPTTWNDLRDTAIALTIKDDKGLIKQSGVAMGTTSNIDDWQEILALLILQNGGKLENLSDPATQQFSAGAFDFYTVFSTKDGVWNDTLPNATTMFANGNLAMMIAPSWRVHDIKAISPNLKFHIVPVPQLPKNNPTDPDITYASYWVSAVSNKSSVQPQAWDFLKFLSSKDSYQKLYENATKVRAFGQPYPRIDMRDLVSSDQYVGGIISLAGSAKSWYLDDRTWDGDTGINSRMSKYFEDAVNSLTKGSGQAASKNLTDTASRGVLQVLVDYGLAAAPPPTAKP